MQNWPSAAAWGVSRSADINAPYLRHRIDFDRLKAVRPWRRELAVADRLGQANSKCDPAAMLDIILDFISYLC